MACVNTNPYAKSCVRAYNNTTQNIAATPTTLNIEGVPVVESGVSLTLNPASIRVNRSGLYHFVADVVFTPTAVGTAILQMYKNGEALPCAVCGETTVANSTVTLHVETDQIISTCCANRPEITFRLGGVAGTVSHTCAGALKLA